MSRTPPLLPEEAFARVLRIARFDGLGVLAIAGVFAVLAATGGDRTGALIGLLVAGAGAMELHGATLLVHGERRGMNWLFCSQIYLMLTILAYCRFRLSHPDVAMWLEVSTAQMKEQAQTLGLSLHDYALLMDRTMIYMFATLTVIYQGLMSLYYLRRRSAVAAVLQHEHLA